jgi:tRNA(fMet)-specific endonuclease VapC
MGRLKYLLDTNICIHFLKNDIKVVEKIKDVGLENCYISEMTIKEMNRIEGLKLENWID